VCKKERINVARSSGKSAMADMLLKRAHNKNGGDMRMPQDLSKEDILKVQVWAPLEGIYRIG
jgi:hypothetical protein